MNISFGTTTDNSITDPTLGQGTAATRPAASQSPEKDDAAVVSLGSSLAELHKQLDSVPEVRDDRVQQLRADIEQGTYTVSPANVASAMFVTLFGGA